MTFIFLFFLGEVHMANAAQRVSMLTTQHKNTLKEVYASVIKRFFGHDIESLKKFDNNFRTASSLSIYMNAEDLKSEYSLLYKDFLISALFNDKKDINYLSFFDWYFLLAESKNIVYNESLHKYEKTKTSCLTRVNPKEDWSLENAKVIKNDKASLKEKSFSGREFIFIEKNNFVVNLFMDGMKVSEILKVIAIIYQQNLTVEAIRATLKKYNISPQAIYHSNIEKRQKSRLQKRQDFEEKKEIEQRESILKYFGNTVEEMQNFDKEFKVLPISDYRKGLYKNSSYFPLYILKNYFCS